MTVNTKFIIFLENMKVYDESLIESIRNAYNLIYESSENVVASIEAKLGNTGEENPLDDEIPEQFTPEEPIEEPIPTEQPEELR